MKLDYTGIFYKCTLLLSWRITSVLKIITIKTEVVIVITVVVIVLWKP